MSFISPDSMPPLNTQENTSGRILGRKRPRSDEEDEQSPSKKVAGMILGTPSSPPPVHPLVLGDVSHHLNRSNNKRVYTSAFSNTTITRANVRPEQPIEELPPLHVLNTESHPGLDTVESNDLCDRILDHSYRRIQLFYYLCVAYWKDGVSVSIDATKLQHGIGPFNGMHAAHSCILPSVKDDFWEKANQTVNSQGMTDLLARELEALGMRAETLATIQGSKEQINLLSYFSDADRAKNLDGMRLICRDSYFYQVMNSTVILPTDVNMYDCCIEAVMRDAALRLLNECSQGTLSPYEATAKFVDEIQRFFDESRAETKQKLDLLQEMYLLEQTLANMEIAVRAVDLDNPNQCLLVFERYVRCAHALKQCVHTIEELKKSLSIKRHIAKRMKDITPVLKPLGPYWRCSKEQLNRKFTEVLPKDPKTVRAHLSELRTNINKRPWCPFPLGYLRTNVEESLGYCDLQQEGSVLPPLEFLSGTADEEGLRPMTEQEIMEQKMEIIRRVPVLEFEDNDFAYESLYPPKR